MTHKLTKTLEKVTKVTPEMFELLARQEHDRIMKQASKLEAEAHQIGKYDKIINYYKGNDGQPYLSSSALILANMVHNAETNMRQSNDGRYWISDAARALANAQMVLPKQKLPLIEIPMKTSYARPEYR